MSRRIRFCAQAIAWAACIILLAWLLDVAMTWQVSILVGGATIAADVLSEAFESLRATRWP